MDADHDDWCVMHSAFRASTDPNWPRCRRSKGGMCVLTNFDSLKDAVNGVEDRQVGAVIVARVVT